jgi:hypothetical protein
MTLFERVHMPSFAGATEWLNSEPLGPAVLQGHVVLVNFWTLTCINWLRQEPYVRAWTQADGLVVIGVHTPEFSFEHDIDGVRQATTERAIDYPVAVDNDYAIWNAFTNNAWPALYFIDTDGKDPRPALRRRTLREIGAPHPEAARRRPRARLVQGLGVEAKADWDHVRTSSRGPSGGAGQSAGQHRQSNNVPPSKRAVPVRSRSPTHAFLRASQHVRPFWRSSGGPPERPARPRETLVVRCIGHELVTTGGPIRPGGGPCSPLRNPPP